MKARLQTSMGQHLVMTPQLRQAIKLLQMSSAELELEINEAVETNPLLDWAENAEPALEASPGEDTPPPAPTDTHADGEHQVGIRHHPKPARTKSRRLPRSTKRHCRVPTTP